MKSAKRGGLFAESDIIPLLITCLAVAVIILIPLKIMGHGFLPTDDILRHVGKAVSGRNWNDVLVMRDGITLDSHPGFHALLGFVHNITKFKSDSLLSFAVIALFISFCITPILFIKRPEAWLAALFVISLTNFSFIGRLLLGRPYIVNMITLTVLCFLWTRLRDDKRPYATMFLITALITLSTWIHCSWYLIIFPIACFVIAREWRAAFLTTICATAGIALGAILTGSPGLFISENVFHAFLVFNKHDLPRTLVTELRPFTGDQFTVIAAILMLSWRRMRGDWDPKRIDNPVFIIALFGWILGFFVVRFWLDWGLPALLVWMAQEFDEVFSKFISPVSVRRLLPAVAVAFVLYSNATNDINDRWSIQPAAKYLFQDFPEKASWMPEPGGILYSGDMGVFFLTFFKNPYAQWRYITGFEAPLMPQEDLDVYLDIQMTRGALQSYDPWIKKMKPQDRLVITADPQEAPKIPELEWRDLGSGFWFGRLRKVK